MIRILGTIFAGLLGLAFGSFLNVCLSRWPEGESIVKPRSHCRSCGRTLAWWENVPLRELAGAARALPELQGVDWLAVSAGGAGGRRHCGRYRLRGKLLASTHQILYLVNLAFGLVGNAIGLRR